jgi:hypothetical protein
VEGDITTFKETKEVKELGESKPSDEKQYDHEQRRDDEVCKRNRGNIICKNKNNEKSIDTNDEARYQNREKLDGHRGRSRL